MHACLSVTRARALPSFSHREEKRRERERKRERETEHEQKGAVPNPPLRASQLCFWPPPPLALPPPWPRPLQQSAPSRHARRCELLFDWSIICVSAFFSLSLSLSLSPLLSLLLPLFLEVFFVCVCGVVTCQGPPAFFSNLCDVVK